LPLEVAEDPSYNDLYSRDIHLDYYIKNEEEFAKTFRKKFNRPKKLSFKRFVKAYFYGFDFKEVDVYSYDKAYWRLLTGLTYPFVIPYYLDVLYRKDTWKFLRGY
jgi:hypothetical protein